MYIIFRNDIGEITAVNKISNGASVNYPTDDDFLTWAAEQNLDLGIVAPDPLTLEQFKAIKKSEVILKAYEKQLGLVADFAPPEQASWSRKVDECKKFTAGEPLSNLPMLKAEAEVLANSQSTPVVIAYATALAGKILIKSDALYRASAQIAGERSKKCTDIDNAATIEAVLLCL